MGLELVGVRRLVESYPGPKWIEWHLQGGGRPPDVLVDEKKPARRRFGREQREIVLAKHALSQEAQQVPELPRGDHAIGDRHRRLDQARAGRKDLVQEVALHLAHQGGERGHVGMDPCRAIDDAAPLDHPWQLRVDGAAQGGHDLRHRRRVDRGGTSQLDRVEGPRRIPKAPRGQALRRLPVDEAATGRLLGAAPKNGHGSADDCSGEEPGLKKRVARPTGPAGATRCGCPVAAPIGRGLAAHASPASRFTASMSGNSSPNILSATALNAATSPVVSWR